ncbi:MAG TPA: hypothetical protein VGJ63_23890 [Micromonosporaceae bacterium]|jgi:hypothetical protein
MRTPRALFVLLLLGVGLGGCADGPAPNMWAASVCEALAPWRAEIAGLTARTQQQMTAKTTPAQAKENLVRLFAGAEAASEMARAKVARAGVPDATNGERVAHGFVTSLTAARDAYGRAKTAIEGLNTAQAKAFYDGVSGVLVTLNEEYARSALDTSNLDSPELKRAFDEVPECH